jgi:GTP-binding protein
MFVDRVTIYCQAGDGGSGCMSFRREARVPRGGPDGGDGGDGGDVVVLADVNVSSLGNIVGHKHWRAGRGEHGKGSLMTGKQGEEAVIRVPPGTLVRDADRGFLLKDLDRDGDSVVVAKGGDGGRGNRV